MPRYKPNEEIKDLKCLFKHLHRAYKIMPVRENCTESLRDICNGSLIAFYATKFWRGPGALYAIRSPRKVRIFLNGTKTNIVLEKDKLTVLRYPILLPYIAYTDICFVDENTGERIISNIFTCVYCDILDTCSYVEKMIEKYGNKHNSYTYINIGGYVYCGHMMTYNEEKDRKYNANIIGVWWREVVKKRMTRYSNRMKYIHLTIQSKPYNFLGSTQCGILYEIDAANVLLLRDQLGVE